MTRSVATTEPRLASQRLGVLPLHQVLGQLLDLLGSIRATVRANSRLVSTSSAATTQRGGFFASGVPGAMTKRVLRVPRYSRLGRLSPLACSPCNPTWDSRPASSASWMPARRAPGGLADRHAEPAGGAAQLAVQVLPLADAQVVQELALHGAAELVAAQRLLLLAEVAPQVEQGEEVGVLVGEPGVQLVGGLLVLAGPLARVLDGQASDDQHLVEHARLSASTTIRAIRGSSGARPARGPVGVSFRLVEGVQLLEQREAVGDGAAVRRVDERKSSTSPRSRAAICSSTEARLVRRISGSVNSGRVSKSASVYSRIAMPGPSRPHRPERCRADAWLTASIGSRCTLVRWLSARSAPSRGRSRSGCRARSATSRRRWWPARSVVPCAGRRPCAGRPPTAASRAGRSRCSAAPARRARPGCRGSPAPRRGTRGCRPALGDQLVDRVEDGGDLVPVGIGALVVRVDDRAVADLDGVGAPADLDDRCAREVGGHPLDVDRRRGDDQLEVGTPGQQLGR